MTELDKKILRLILQRSHYKMQLNASYGSTISVSPSTAWLKSYEITKELNKLTLLRDRIEKIKQIKNKIK